MVWLRLPFALGICHQTTVYSGRFFVDIMEYIRVYRMESNGFLVNELDVFYFPDGFKPRSGDR